MATTTAATTTASTATTATSYLLHQPTPTPTLHLHLKMKKKESLHLKPSYPYLSTPKEYRFIRWIILISLLFLIIASLMLALAIPYRAFITASLDSSQSVLFVSPTLRNCSFTTIDEAKLCVVSNKGIFVKVRPNKFDFSTSVLSLTVEPVPTALFCNEVGILQENIKFEFSSTTVTARKNQKLVPFDVDIPIDVDYSNYPFETFTPPPLELLILDEEDNAFPFIVAENRMVSIPSLEFDAIQAVVPEGAEGFDYVALVVGFRRNIVTRVIVIITWILLHMWAIMFMFMSLQAVFRERQVFSIMIWIAGGIIATGTIRKLQPEAPPVGTTGDVVTYIWSLIAGAVGTFAIFCAVFRDHKPKNPKDKEMEKRDKERRWRKLLSDEAAAEKEDEEAVVKGTPNVEGAAIVNVVENGQFKVAGR
ncbi:hypothetical protein BC829DRAFT_382399 [Chytridium lagenaria]|nr:hypothetical protein BC829DRAFT_382399 [Chytridium lagenaria]